MNKKNSIENIVLDFADFGLLASYHNQYDYGMHTHDFVEMVYVVHGQGKHCFAGQKYPIIAGDLFVVNTTEPHGYEDTKKLRIANVIVTREFLNGYLVLLQTMPGFTSMFSLEPLFRSETAFRYKLHLSAAIRLRIEKNIDDLITELYAKTDGYKVAATGLMLQLFAGASRAFALRNTKPSHSDFSGKEKAVSQAIAYLESQFDKVISLKDIAEFSCMSGSRLSHIFKEATGTSLMDYLLTYRLDRAHELLRAGNKSISDIAFTVGFHDPGYFSRAFRNHFGHTPRKVLPSE